MLRAMTGSLGPMGVAAGRVPWYRAGGAPMPVAAYQPKGAASYAASLVNIANPGTYNATEGVAPSWATGTGWDCRTPVLSRLECAVVPSSGWSAIISLNVVEPGGGNYGRAFEDSSGNAFGILPTTGAPGMLFKNGGMLTIPNQTGVLILAIAAASAYVNGVLAGAIPVGAGYVGPIHLGNRFALDRHLGGFIRSFAIYSSTLTAPEVAAVSAAMAAL